MDALTHSLVGLTTAKAGLDRLSPYATACCVLSANAPDIDVVYLLAGRWTFLQHHRGLTHSIIGTFALGVLIPTFFYFTDWMGARVRKRPATIRYRGLLVASLIAAATHPLMDWTNNYGLRPFLPWNGTWFYGDLVFIIDPYIMLVVGGVAFLLTSDRWLKIAGWSVLAAALTLLIFLVSAPRVAGGEGLAIARTIWVAGILFFVVARKLRREKRLGKSIAIATLVLVASYWGALAWAHHAAYRNALDLANHLASQRGEHFIRMAAMPTVANPFRWQCVAETDRAMYRFFIGVWSKTSSDAMTNESVSDSSAQAERYEKPSGQSERLVSSASADQRALIFLNSARFPIARVENDNCIGQTLVQFADLRYTEPGGPARGNFALDVPVDCPAP